MNLFDLKVLVDHTIEAVIEEGNSPGETEVSLQIDGLGDESVCSRNVELHYDGDVNVSGCVLLGLDPWKA